MREVVGHPTYMSVIMRIESCKAASRINVEFRLWISRRDDFPQHLDDALFAVSAEFENGRARPHQAKHWVDELTPRRNK